MYVRFASKFNKSTFQPIPVAALSKAWVCGLSLAGISASNPAGCMGASCECFLLSGRGLCDGPIPRPEESYLVWCVIKYNKRFTLTVSRYIEVKTKKEERKRIKPEGKRPLGRPRRRWEDNIKMDLEEVGGGCGDWVELAQDRDRWPALVNTVMNLRVPKMRGIS